MRYLASLCLVAATLLVSPSYVAAQSRAELQSFVEQLQANPSDTMLRQRIIATARKLKPSPSIPEAARSSFVQGTAIEQSAKDSVGQTLAIQRFQDALKLAPWWSDAWHSLSVAQEAAGLFDAAQESLRFYILTGPNEVEVRKARDRIYALKAKKELATAEAADAALRAQADPELRWNGQWLISWTPSGSTSRMASKKVGDTIGFYPDGWMHPIFEGQITPTGAIRWQRWGDACGWFPLDDVAVSPDFKTITIQQRMLNVSDCRWEDDPSPVIIRRQ
jgi:hypothetical protein